jgi:hypothetical protein
VPCFLRTAAYAPVSSLRERGLMLIIAGVVVVLLLVIGAGVWFLLPTLRSSRAEFDPVAKDDDSTFQAQQSFTTGGGGAGAGT